MAESDRSASAPPQPERLWAALTGSLRDGLDLARVRLELLGVEAQAHARAVVASLCLGLAATLLLCLGLGFFAALLTVLWWEGQRALALGMFAVLFLTLGGLAAWLAWRGLSSQSPWFESSTRELAQDVDKLRP